MSSDEIELGDEVLTPTALARTVQESREMIDRGDFSEVEAQLITQTVALESMFQIYFEKMLSTEYLEAQHIFGSLALKAQSQARKTIKTLVTTAKCIERRWILRRRCSVKFRKSGKSPVSEVLIAQLNFDYTGRRWQVN